MRNRMQQNDLRAIICLTHGFFRDILSGSLCDSAVTFGSVVGPHRSHGLVTIFPVFLHFSESRP